MRALHVMASGARGGGADHLLGLLPALSSLGWDCWAAVGDDGPLADRLRLVGVDVHDVRLMGSRFDLGASRRVRAEILRARPDVVHLHGTRAAFYSALARVQSRSLPPAVYTVHGLSFSQETSSMRSLAFYAAEAVACRGAAHVISVSERDLKRLVRLRFVRADRGTHVANAIDVERFGRADRATVRRRLGLQPEAFVVGTVARMVPQKAVADLVAALDACPSAHLVLVGDGPQRREVEARAARFGGRVLLLGARDDVPELLAAFDAFALSSRWEGEPIALLEAMAACQPCVATATEGAREILVGTGAGVLVPIGDPAALGAALEQLATDPDRRRAMGEAGRRAVAGRNWAGTATEVDRIYRSLLQS